MPLWINQRSIELVEGDITKQKVDAIVNAANSRLAGGGGVDGAIHRAGGPSILEECQKIGGCPPGEARATGAGNLAARWVIHAVGPIYRDGVHGEDALLASAYRQSLLLADSLGARSIAFPAISTGAYAFPLEEAAQIAIETAAAHLAAGSTSIERVLFVLFGRPAFEAFQRAVSQVHTA